MDWTLHASDLLVLGGFFLVVIMRMSKMETKVESMWNWFLTMIPPPADGERRRSDAIYRDLNRRQERD